MSFEFYRRRQREVLAILVLVAIFSFIVVPSLQQFMGDSNSSAQAGPVVVRWRGGQLHQNELARMVQAKGQTVNFLVQVANEVIKRGGMPNVPGFRFDFQNNQIQALGINSFVSELAVARSKILTEKARLMGVVFDDVAIDTFLSDFVNSKLTSKELKEYMDKVSGGELTRYRLYQVLKTELASTTLEATALAGLNSGGRPIMSPGQAWQYFDRLNRQARIEAFPVLVSDFLDKVKEEPSEEEVSALYEKYKDQFSSPMVAEPGFRKRYTTNLEVIELSIEPFVATLVAKLPEDQIRAEYQRRVEQGQYRRPAVSVPSTTTPSTESPAVAPPAAETPASTTPAAITSDAAATPVSPTLEPPAATPPTETPAAATPAANPTSEPPTTETPPAPATETPPASGTGGDGSTNNSQSSSDERYPNPLRPRLVAFQETTQESAPAAEGTPVQPPAESAAAPAQETPAATPPAAQENPTDAPPPVEPPPGLEGSPAAEPAAATETPAVVAPTVADEIIPFEEVREEIARSLVLTSARETMQTAVATVERPMQKYYTDFSVHQVAVEMKDPSAKEAPVRPDVKRLAEAAGLPYRQTGMIDIVEIIRTPLGRSRAMSGESFADQVFSDKLTLFQPIRSMDFDFTAGKVSEFLVWKVEDKKPYIPSLADVRDEVVKAWKKEKAEKLAETDASAIVTKLKTSGGTEGWKAVLSETQLPLLVQPTLFTWMSGADQFNPFLTEVEGIDTAGPEFMQKVFATPANEMVVTTNGPRTVYYAVKVVEFLPAQTELEKRFASDTVQTAPRTIAFSDAQEMFATWYGDIEKELEVQWSGQEDQLD